MENSGNPMRINITNNPAALKYFYIATAIKKYLCLAFCSLYLFLAKK
jgi:hypothetical protein